jgi:hypothetical protein
VYVVGAVVVDRVEADGVRRAARSLLVRRQRRFHWYEEGDAQRMRMLSWTLSQDGVHELVLERRQERNNRRDMRTITGAKAAKRAAKELRWRFEPPEAEPLFWLADAVASVTSAVLVGAAHGRCYADLLAGHLEQVHVGP